MQIDLHTVAALLTIVGYSLNDTIIVFDRIREDMRLMHKQTARRHHQPRPQCNFQPNAHDLRNHPARAHSSHCFRRKHHFLICLVMAIGVIFGTLSSLFIAAPLMLFFHRREIRGENPKAANSVLGRKSVADIRGSNGNLKNKSGGHLTILKKNPARRVGIRMGQADRSEFTIHPATAQVLASRGLKIYEIHDFLYAKLPNLHDPHLFPDMDKAVDRIPGFKKWNRS